MMCVLAWVGDGVAADGIPQLALVDMAKASGLERSELSRQISRWEG